MGQLQRHEYEAQLRGIRLLATDVDGVLTDGSINYTGDQLETKRFNVRDGSAAYIARLIELPVVVITARRSDAVARRFAELPVHALFQGAFDKVTACWEVQQELGIADHEVAYVGDDLVDIGLMQRVGIGITVADAHPRVLAVADWVTARRGGGGAFREVVDDIVGARDLWDRVTADYARRQCQE